MEVERAIAIEVDAERCSIVVGRRRRESFRPLEEEVLGRLPSLLNRSPSGRDRPGGSGRDGPSRRREGAAGPSLPGERRSSFGGPLGSSWPFRRSVRPGAFRRSPHRDDPLRRPFSTRRAPRLGEVSAWLRGHIETEARSRGWGTGPASCPGPSRDGPSRARGRFAAFLVSRRRRMTLTDPAVLRLTRAFPSPSASGPATTTPGCGPCGDCPRRKSCQWRKN